MKQPGPIAVFDSGYGGLTVLNKLIEHLPQYDYIYLGDNARTPYGTRSFEVVYEYTLQAVKKLFDMGANLVILACNTASAKALRNIQQKDLPHIDPQKRVLGVIRPSVEVVDTYSETKHVGILGTVGTIQSESYPIEINKLFPSVQVAQEACPMWVPLVENNEFDKPGTDYFVKQHVDNLFKQDTAIDTVILGCTHYPLLTPKIKPYLPAGVQLLEQGDIVGESLKDYLFRHPEMDAMCSKGGTVHLYTTEQVTKFKQTAGIFFEGETNVEHLVL
ncbi:glutamate racemase [Carboxylicivirga sediminis]|uniref:Glutamate racemase n=1 Tax=Carboxylicivirga sediminis TaxID=2006564 RepID=A0A941IYH3_9BACT|nr:glutamate racemase [Carboxylicivirga sediminis]MBR8536504.1 glutamate racemase [Carboxylicivirga sediminis]